jgi:hypothetical protein
MFAISKLQQRNQPGRSLAFDLLKTVRLLLRKVARYGKNDKSDEDDE